MLQLHRMIATPPPIIGPLRNHWSCELTKSPFAEFASPTGISGLALVNGQRLDLLSVIATREDCGQFRDFIKQCKLHYLHIRLWLVENPVLTSALERYGFKRGHDMDFDGKMQEVWDWEAAPSPLPH